jgi:NDP-sugar pyrophosphorylase family protein
MNIFISLCGKDEKFKEYVTPKPFVNAFGKPMINWVIDNLQLASNDILYIIYESEHLPYLYNIKSVQKTLQTIRYVHMKSTTSGPLNTYINTINQDGARIDNELPCVIIDCDTFFTFDVLGHFRKYKHQNIAYCFEDTGTEPIYSYVSITKQGYIKSMKENVKISTRANTGCYCFSSTRLVDRYGRAELKKNPSAYVSHMINRIIREHDASIYMLKQTDFQCLGSPQLLTIFSNTQKHTKQRFCFDLTAILASPTNQTYVRYLKSHGHTIMIESDVDSSTHGADIYQLLSEQNVPYDEVYMNRPRADFYIKDVHAFKQVERETGYYNTSIDERSFNIVKTARVDVIVKHSNNRAITGEIYWYQNIPSSVQHLFPKFYSSTPTSYTIEKIKNISLSYLYIQGQFQFLKKC